MYTHSCLPLLHTTTAAVVVIHMHMHTCKAKSKKEEKVQKQLRIGIQPLCDPERGAALTVPCDTFMRVRQPPPQTLLLTTPQPHRPSGQPVCSPFVR